MRPRQITNHGWSVEDDLRADRIERERQPGPTDAQAVRERWNAMFGPHIVVHQDGTRVILNPTQGKP